MSFAYGGLFSAGHEGEKDVQLEKILSLGYVSVAEVAEADRGKSNVTSRDFNGSYPGINVYCVKDSGTANFMDMQGRIVHAISNKRFSGCELLEPLDEDNFLMIVGDKALVKLDWGSNIIWTLEGVFHHDVTVDADGLIYSLTRREINFTASPPARSILDNCIVTINPDGKQVGELCFSELAARDENLLRLMAGKEGDVFHSNTLEIIPRDVDLGGGVIFNKGDLLFSLRQMNTIGVIDLAKRRIVWRWGEGVLDSPHQPSLQENGTILVFDNGKHRNETRLLEMDPASGRIIWEYKGKPPADFFSSVMGGAQRLPNGNILVTESMKGHVFEIAPSGATMWDYWEPQLDREGRERRVIYRMNRLPRGFRNITVQATAADHAVMATSSPDMCDSVSYATASDDCNLRLGAILHNTSFCEKIADSDKRDECHETNAQTTKDASKCERISDERSRQRCVGRIGAKLGNLSYCVQAEAADKDWCIREVAIHRNDFRLCVKISDSAERDRCYSATAVSTGDPEACTLISEEWRRLKCEKNIKENAQEA
jgi:hypothetical protein